MLNIFVHIKIIFISTKYFKNKLSFLQCPSTQGLFSLYEKNNDGGDGGQDTFLLDCDVTVLSGVEISGRRLVSRVRSVTLAERSLCRHTVC